MSEVTSESAAPVTPAAEPAAPVESSAPPTEGQSQAPSADWRASLSQELRDHPAIKDYQTPDALVQSHIEAQSYIGNSVRVPSEHASAEDWDAFRAKLSEKVPNLQQVDPASRPPESAMDYKAPEPLAPMLPNLNQELVGKYGTWAHEAGLNQSQYEKLMERFVEAETQSIQAREAEKQQGYAGLREQWGYAYEEKRDNAARLAQLTNAPEEFVQAIQGNAVKPEIMAWLGNLAEQYGREGQVVDNAKGRTHMTPNEALAQIDEIKGNRDHPYYTAPPGSPERKRVRERIMELRNLAMGQEGRRVHAVLGGADEESEYPGGTLFAGRA